MRKSLTTTRMSAAVTTDPFPFIPPMLNRHSYPFCVYCLSSRTSCGFRLGRRQGGGAATSFALFPRASTASSQARISLIRKSLTTTSMTASKDLKEEGDLLFGRFIIPADSIFHRTHLSFGFCNLRPIVSGHVLVSPKRVVPQLQDLTNEEYIDLWLVVRATQTMLKQHYTDCNAFNVAVQDGRAAGQSVPHVHVHILPRRAYDFERNDDVYDELSVWAPRDELVVNSTLAVADDKDRTDRTLAQMAEEAAAYRSLFANNDNDSKL
ncbi:hypothetical protein MPSEU_000138600 [Mayamaea pseudoterrestris]|nr:hypothetical protein MPSEU_000138600 [Mayamaea pseudoterrestris]